MGAAGAAFATVLSQLINLIIVGEYFYSKKSVAHISLCFVTLQKKLLSEITKIGFPAFIRNTCSSITVILVNVLLKPYGDYAIATIAIVMRVQMFGIFLAVGLAQGFQPIAGYNFGARKFERLFEAIKKASLIALLMTFSVALLNWIAPQWVLRIFTDDIKIIEMGTYALRVSFVIFPFLGVQIVFTNLFQAIGKAVPAMLLALSRQLLFYVPALLILSKIAKYPGIIWSQPVADFLTMILAIAFMIGITRFLQNESITESNQ
jgi:Na+-driven multidrug efflux pump